MLLPHTATDHMSMGSEAGRADSGDRALNTVLERLTDPDPRVRALAADEASDYFRGGISGQAATETAVAKLVAAAVADDEDSVREAALHACHEAVSHHDLPLALFDPLVPLMPRLPAELIGYVLAILGATHDPAARPIIASYANHPNRSVRAEAAEALVELAGRSS